MSIYGEGTRAAKFSGAKASKIASFSEIEVSSGLSGYIGITE